MRCEQLSNTYFDRITIMNITRMKRVKQDFFFFKNTGFNPYIYVLGRCNIKKYFWAGACFSARP